MRTDLPIPLTRLRYSVPLVALLFTLIYFEPVAVGSIKFAAIWRAAFVFVAVYLIATHWGKSRLDLRAAGGFAAAWVWYTLSPLMTVALIGASDVDSIQILLQRLFPLLVVVTFAATGGLRAADFLLRLVPIFLCLAALPFLLGLMKPLGLVTSLSAVAGVDINAFIGVFQNVHSAAFAYAIGALISLALAYRAPRWAARIFYTALAIACFGVIVLTAARAGLAAALIGVVVLSIGARNWKVPASALAVLVVTGAVTVAARPELIDVAENRLLAKNIYQNESSADHFTSGRLTLQQSAIDAYRESPLVNQLFGVGKEESMLLIEKKSGYFLVAHNGFIDELTVYGVFSLAALLAALGCAVGLSVRNAARGQPLGLSLVAVTIVMTLLQGIEYSLHLALIGLVIMIETSQAAAVAQTRMAPSGYWRRGHGAADST